jgi:hypothetical protein
VEAVAMNNKDVKIYEFEYHGLMLWYELNVLNGTIWSYGVYTEDSLGKFEHWDEFKMTVREELFTIIKNHALCTYKKERGMVC